MINLFWTTAGIFPGDGEISRFEFKDRVEAAARAGFKSIGLWHTEMGARIARKMKPIFEPFQKDRKKNMKGKPYIYLYIIGVASER